MVFWAVESILLEHSCTSQLWMTRLNQCRTFQLHIDKVYPTESWNKTLILYFRNWFEIIPNERCYWRILLLKTYNTKLGRFVTPILLPVTAPVLPLFILATLILPLCLHATVSKRASNLWQSSQSSRKKCTSQSPVVAPEDACQSIVNKHLLNKLIMSLFYSFVE